MHRDTSRCVALFLPHKNIRMQAQDELLPVSTTAQQPALPGTPLQQIRLQIQQLVQDMKVAQQQQSDTLRNLDAALFRLQSDSTGSALNEAQQATRVNAGMAPLPPAPGGYSSSYSDAANAAVQAADAGVENAMKSISDAQNKLAGTPGPQTGS